MGDTYSVRVAASIAKRGEGATRRRAGLTFGAEETIVSTDKEREGATHVTKKQLQQILDDSNLRAGDQVYPEPGLRVKEVAPTAEHAHEDAGSDQEEEVTPEEKSSKPAENIPASPEAEAPTRQPGRPRKAAKE